MATASTGPVDPTEATRPQSQATVVFNAATIVFREGLEAVLIFAAVTASFLGANKKRRRPVVAGAAVAFGVSIVTWFLVQALLAVASPLGPRLEAITGFIAVVVLLSSSTGSSTRSTGQSGSVATTASGGCTTSCPTGGCSS